MALQKSRKESEKVSSARRCGENSLPLWGLSAQHGTVYLRLDAQCHSVGKLLEPQSLPPVPTKENSQLISMVTRRPGAPGRGWGSQLPPQVWLQLRRTTGSL